MKNKKILMIGPSFSCHGGIAEIAMKLYKYLKSKKYNVNYLGSKIDGHLLKKYFYTLYSYIKFLKLLMLNKYLLIHIHCSVNRSFFRKLFYILLAQAKKTKIVLQIHPERFNLFYQNSNKLTQNLLNKIFKKITAVIVLSSGIKKKFSEFLPDMDIYVLNNPIVSSDYKCISKKNKKMILYLGWIIPEKGVYDIFHIIPEVIKIFPSTKFIFCGIKEIDKLKSLSESSSFKNNVVVKGWVDKKEKINLLSKSTMLLLPSYSEGFPNVLLEAMASCLPVITTPVGAIPEIIKNKINGFLISPGDREALKEKILLLLKEPALCQRMGSANEKLIKEKFDIGIIGKDLLNIYSKI